MDRDDLDFDDIIDNLMLSELSDRESSETFEQVVENVLFPNGLLIPEELIVENLPRELVDGEFFVTLSGELIPYDDYIDVLGLMGSEPIEVVSILPFTGGGASRPFVLGDVGPTSDLSDLLPPTALQFTIPEEREFDPFFVDDDTPVVGANEVVQLDDDALSGNPGGTGDDADGVNVVGTLSGTTGADDPGVFAITGMDLPAGFAITSNDGTTIIINQGGTDVLQVVIDSATGAYTVTQLSSIDHAAGLDENNIEFTLNYTLTDSDNDSASGTLVINVDDDTPVVGANEVVQLDDDALSGNPGGTGDDADGVNVVGTLSGTTGADDPGVFAITGMDLPAGFAITSNDGTTIIINQGGTDVLQVVIDSATGAYTVTQLSSIDHAAGLDENNIEFTLNYTLTDSDNDSASGTLVINVDDDTPVVGANEVVQLDDDALSGNPGGTGDDADGVNVVGTLSGTTGADDPGVFAITGMDLPAGFAITSNDGTTIIINQGGTDVLQVVIDSATGAYTVTQLSSIDHAAGLDENNIEFTLNYTLTDSDNDSASGTLVINVDDDTPVVGANEVVQLDDDALSGNPGGTGDDADGVNVVGTLSGTTGADDPGVFAITGMDLPAGFAITSNDGTTIIINQGGTDVLQVVIDSATGAYTVTQLSSIDHAAGLDENNIEFTLNYTLTDSDNDSASGTLVINVDDDTPVVGANEVVQLDDDALSGNPGGTGDDADGVNVVGTLSGTTGADDPGVFAITGMDLPAGFAITSNDGTTIIINQGGTDVLQVVIDSATGAYTVTQLSSIDHAAGLDENNIEFTLNYTLTDSDNDSASGTLVINVDDDTPVVGANEVVQLDDDALSGNPGGTGDDADGVNVVGTLSGTTGADDPGVFAITGMDLPAGFAITSNDGTTIIINQGGTDVLQVVIDSATGAYTVTQLSSIDHAAGLDENNIEFTLNYTLTDSDNDSASGTLVINVDDDTPVVGANEVVQLDDDALSGNPGGTGDDADGVNVVGTLSGTTGADDPGVFAITGMDLPAGFAITSNDGTTIIINQGGTDVLQVVIDSATGAYTVTQLSSIDHAAGLDENNIEFTLNYTLTDSDNDSASGTLVINVDDDTPVVGANEVVQLDDDALSGNPGGTGDDADGVNVVGTLSGTTGADDPGVFAITGMDLPAGFAITSNDGTTIIINQGGTDVLQVVIDSATGAYTVTQLSSIDHAAGLDENNIEFTLNYTLTDSDNDSASGTLVINVDDDTPVVGANEVVQLDDDALSGNPGGTGDDADGVNVVGTLSGTTGADDPGVFAITGMDLPAGFAITSNDGTTIIINQGGTDVLQVVIDSATGAYTVTQLSSIDHAAGLDENNIEFTLNYTLTDSDNDSASGTLVINVDDDTPVVGANEVVQLDDDALSGNPGGTGDDADGVNVVGTLSGTTGADDPGVFAITGMDLPAGFAITSNDGTTIIINQGGTDVLQVVIDSATGAYTVTQLSSIDHAAGLDENNIEFTLNYTLTDSDNDSASGTLVINVDDDTPVVGANEVVQLDDDALSGNPGGTGDDADGVNVVGTLSGTTGADDPGVFAITGMDLPAGFAITSNDGTTIIINQGGTDVLQVVIDSATGAYTVTQLSSIDHAAGLDENNIEFTLNYTLTDSDNDSASGTLVINVDDDTPVVGANEVVQLDDDALSGNPGGTGDDADGVNVVGTLSGTTGADDPGVFAITGMDLPAGFAITSNDGTTIIINQGGTDVLQVVIDSATGAYTVTQLSSIDHAAGLDENNIEFTLNYTLTDSDNDSASGTLVINVDDDTPVVGANEVVQLDDDALSGNPGGTGDDADGVNVVGTLSGTTGADDPGVFAITGMDLPAGFAITSNDGTTIIINQGGTDVLQVVIDSATGAYTVTQLSSIDHAAGLDENNIEFTLNYTLTDSDNDSASGTLVINVDDDTPVVGANEVVQLDDDALSGNPGGTGDDADGVNVVGTLSGTTGADDPGVFAITGMDLPAGFAITSNDGTTIIINQGGTDVLQVVIDSATGAYTVTQLSSIDHAAGLDENNIEFTLNYTLTDSDNDSASGTLVINVDDDTPVVGANEVVQLDDDALSGNPGGTGDDADGVNVVGTLSGTTGADDPGVFAITGMDLPAGFAITSNDGTTIIINQGGTDVLQVVIDSATGAYTVTQLSSIDHAAGLDENNIEFTLNYTLTDSDNDSASGTLVINVDDDTPVVGANEVVQLDDDALSGNPGGTGDDADGVNVVGTLSGTTGADDPGVFAITGMDLPAGFAITSNDGTTIIINQGGTDVLQVVIDSATGAYTVTQLSSIDHAAGLDENNIEFTLNYTLTDSDNDSASGTLVINVDDDTPVVVPGSTGNYIDNDVGATEDFSLYTTEPFGADGPGSITFTDFTDGDEAMDANGDPVKLDGTDQVYLFGAGTDMLIATTDPTGLDAGAIVYTVQINTDGTYTVDVLQETVFSGDIISVTNLSSAAGGGNVDTRGIGVDDTTNALDVLISGSDSVNTNSTEIGIGSGQDINGSGETARIDFVSNLESTTDLTTYPTGFTYDDHIQTTVFSQLISWVQGSSNATTGIVVTAINADNDQIFDVGTTAEAGESFVTIIDVKVFDENDVDVTGDAQLTITYNGDGTVTILGLSEDWTYQIETATDFSAVQVQGIDGETPVKLGIFSIGGSAEELPVDLNYNVEITDGDGDSVTTIDAVTFTIGDPPPPPPDAFNDNMGNLDNYAEFSFDGNHIGDSNFDSAANAAMALVATGALTGQLDSQASAAEWVETATVLDLETVKSSVTSEPDQDYGHFESLGAEATEFAAQFLTEMDSDAGSTVMDAGEFALPSMIQCENDTDGNEVMLIAEPTSSDMGLELTAIDIPEIMTVVDLGTEQPIDAVTQAIDDDFDAENLLATFFDNSVDDMLENLSLDGTGTQEALGGGLSTELVAEASALFAEYQSNEASHLGPANVESLDDAILLTATLLYI